MRSILQMFSGVEKRPDIVHRPGEETYDAMQDRLAKSQVVRGVIESKCYILQLNIILNFLFT